MGEAARRRAAQEGLIYHHTSTLRTNQIWMSGVVLPEGKMPPVIHPKLGEVRTDAFVRRAMKDFPPAVWLTRRIEVPNCMRQIGLRFVDRETGVERPEFAQEVGPAISDAIALNRMSLGFRHSDVPAVPWQDHPGYATGEGRELNETARDVGDDPDDWWIDVMAMAEIRVSYSVRQPKLERNDEYLGHVKEMVARCRATPGCYIPPAWLSPAQAHKLAADLGVPVFDPGAGAGSACRG